MSSPGDEVWLRRIDEKLGILIMLNATNLSANKDLDNPAKIRLLSLAGFTSEEIGKMIGVRGDTVRHIRSESSRKKASPVEKGGEDDVK